MPTSFVQANNYSEAIRAGAFRRERDAAAQDGLGVYLATEGCEVDLRRGVRIGRAYGASVATRKVRLRGLRRCGDRPVGAGEGRAITTQAGCP
jgi:hypothetical protein